MLKKAQETRQDLYIFPLQRDAIRSVKPLAVFFVTVLHFQSAKIDRMARLSNYKFLFSLFKGKEMLNVLRLVDFQRQSAAERKGRSLGVGYVGSSVSMMDSFDRLYVRNAGAL